MEDITPTLPEEADVTSAGGNEGAASESPEVVSVKDVIGEVLGKQFPSDEAALKSIKDTSDYVGKLGQVVKKLQEKSESSVSNSEISELKQTITRLSDENFYSKNPQYDRDEYRDVLSALRATTGKPLQELVKDRSFVSLFEKANAYEQDEKTKSVLQTNPRLGQVTDKRKEATEALEKSNEAVRSGNHDAARAYHDSAINAALQAVNEAYAEK